MSTWRDRALCLSFPDMPWIAEPQDRSVAAERAMAVVCTSCPVQLECAAYADRYRICAGFWAGNDRGTYVASDGAA